MNLKLNWQKQSHRRYSAYCGPGLVEVRKVGIADINAHWRVGEVFGRHHHSASQYPCPETMTLPEAQAMAEGVAADMIVALSKSPLAREFGIAIGRLAISERLRRFLAESGCQTLEEAEWMLARDVWTNKTRLKTELRAVVENPAIAWAE